MIEKRAKSLRENVCSYFLRQGIHSSQHIAKMVFTFTPDKSHEAPEEQSAQDPPKVTVTTDDTKREHFQKDYPRPITLKRNTNWTF